MSFSKNFYKLFIEPEEKSKEWDDKIFEYGEAGEVEKLDKHLNSANELYLEEKQIYTAINTFTLSTETIEEKRRLLDLLSEEEFIKELSYDDFKISLKTVEDIQISAIKLSNFIPKLNDEIIETLERKGQCHTKSLSISSNMGIPNNVVTGYIFGFSDKSKYLHSWIEFNLDGKEMVIDYSLNIIMNKDGYYYLQHAIPLSKISDKDIQEDNKIIKKFGKIGYFNIKEYLVFRDEIMKDFQKNKSVFEDER